MKKHPRQEQGVWQRNPLHAYGWFPSPFLQDIPYPSSKGENGCGAEGEVIDFTAALYGLGKKEAAMQIAQDFGLSYEDWKPPGKAKKPKPRQKSPEEQFQESKNRCFRILADYLHLLMAWRTDYTPHSPEEVFHPRFVEALQKQSHVEYLLDVLLFGEIEEQAALITDYGKDVIQLEQRMAELAAADAARTKKHHELP